MSSKPRADEPKEFEEGKITVVVRCRPFNEREHTLRSIPCIDFNADGQTLQIYERGVPSPSNPDGEKGKSHTFTFDKSYHQQVTQESVYIDVGRPVLAASLRGFNTCIFAYGQTGSGKSFAMMGPAGGRDANKLPGIIPRLCTELFQQVADRARENEAAIAEALAEGVEECNLPPKVTITVDVSYLEIYQEKVKCLLDPKKDNLKVRQHPALGVYVDQLTEVSVGAYEKVMSLIEGGNTSRHIASTNMNDASSRSHAIFAISVAQKRQSKTKDGQESITVVRSKINLVDLAGSERAKSTGAEGDTLREGAQINRSLTVLGLVISGLAEQSKAVSGKAPFIPYRDSTLTFLLKESLGGNSKTYMMSTLSPAHVNYEETLSTLRYADRAKAIVTKACVNESAGDKKIRELEDEVGALREKLREYQAKMEKQSEVAKVVPKLNLVGLGANQATRGRTALSATGGRGNGGGRASYALATPRSAISRVIMDRDVDGDEEQMDDSENYIPQQTPRAPGDVARLEERLHLAEALMGRLTETEEQKEMEADTIIEVMRQKKTVKATRADPHLLNLDADVVSDFIVEYLVDEVTYLGTEPLETEVVNSRCIILSGEHVAGVGPQHCSFLRTQDGRVTLRPEPGYDTFLNMDDDPIDGEVTLTNGTVVCVGDNMIQFKFVDPAAALPMTARRRGTIMGNSQSRPRASVSVPVAEPSQARDSRAGTPASDSVASTPPTPTPLTTPATEEAPQVLRVPIIPKLNLNIRTASVAAPRTEVVEPMEDPETLQEKSPSPEKPFVPTLALPARPATAAAPFQQGPSTGRNTTQNIGTTRPATSTARGLRNSFAGKPNAPSAPTVVAFNEEVQACFRHTFLFLGKPGSGKSSFRAALGLKDKWYSFFKKETIAVQPTFGVEVSRVECGTLQKVELTLMELSGRESFTLLQNMLPERRVTYVLCARLDDEQLSLATFRNYLEFILCQSATSETTVMILATHRDAAGKAASEDRRIVDILGDLEGQIRTFFEMLQPVIERRPRVVAKFAVDNNERTVLSGSSKISKFPELLAFLGDHAVHRCRSDVDFPNCLVPTRLLTLSRKLLEIRAQGRWCMPSSDYKSIAKQCDQRYERSLEELHRHTQLLHCWGVLHHQYRHLLLKKTIILDTTWVMQLLTVICCCIPGHDKVAFIQSRDFEEAYRDRIPFNVRDIAKADPFGLCGRGVLTTAAANEMLRLLLREKNMSIRNVDAVMELLENYDVVMKGSKLKMSTAHQTLSRGSSGMSSTSSFSSQQDAANDHEDHDGPQSFYLIPACFVGQTPAAVTIQLPKLLIGPFYRFSLNMIPPFFFARFVSRVSRYAQRMYVGPVSSIHVGPASDAKFEEDNTTGIRGGLFWNDSVWIVSSPTSRALARMVHHSLFITFHDAAQDEEFHEGLRHVVQCLVAESPGMQCEEAILCRKNFEDTEEECQWRATDENINSLEKIRERESSALKSARGGTGRGGIAELMRRKAEASEDGGDYENEDDTPVPFVRPLDIVIDEAEVLANIGRDCLLTDDVLHRVEKALKLISRGQTMQDRDRGLVLEGRGMDSLVDALAQA